jgi:hypothetical protein
MSFPHPQSLRNGGHAAGKGGDLPPVFFFVGNAGLELQPCRGPTLSKKTKGPFRRLAST